MLAVRALALSFVASLAIAGSSLAATQGGIPPSQYVPVFEAWVDPVLGDDATGTVNDPDLPFKKLQSAIDETFNRLSADHQANPTRNRRGIVYALPGIYGPAGVAANPPDASGDEFPIRMRDRVSVKGSGARRCVLRGVGAPSGSAPTVFWPDGPSGGAVSIATPVEVLVTFYTAYPGLPPTPSWWDVTKPWKDALEAIDAFTFEGGDVHVFAPTGLNLTGYTQKGVVSNCVFDMRHDWSVDAGLPNVQGPWVGVLMPKNFIPGNQGLGQGYVDNRMLLANNTFVMARYLGGGNWETCRAGAVGVIDVTNPTCNFVQRDCDDTLRGVGNPGLLNNLFRTPPASVGLAQPAFAMLGIESTDTRVYRDASDTQGVQTNAFAAPLVGSSNGRFWSTPMETGIVNPALGQEPDYWDCGGATLEVLWSQFPCCPVTTTPPCPCPGPCPCPNVHSCASAALPVPAIAMYHSLQTERDPGFVGEYIDNLAAPPFPNYRDWRLLPQSPLKDQGYLPAGDPRTIAFVNGSAWEMDDLPFDPFEWDGEGYGNPRVVDASTDIGADELHFFTMSASWANDSNSHNQRGRLDGTGPAGSSMRYVILPVDAAGTSTMGNTVVIHGKAQDVPAAPSVPSGWTQPPATLANPAIGAVPPYPLGYEKKYIAFNNAGPPQPPTPWTRSITPQDLISNYHPLDTTLPAESRSFVRYIVADDECTSSPCVHWYFNTQMVVLDGSQTELLRSNMQAEYR